MRRFTPSRSHDAADRTLRLARARRVVVIGAGFIGTRVAGAIAAAGDDVVVLTRSPPGPGRLPAEVTVLAGDAADPRVLDVVLEGADAVVFCAGGLMPADAAADPHADLTLGLAPLLALLGALRSRPHAELVFLSSGGTVYGPPQRNPVSETHPTNPISAYGVSKLAAEKYIAMHVAVHGLRARVLRCANVYGPGQPADRGQGAIAVFLDRARAGLPLPVFGDGSAVRDYLFVDDLAEIVARLTGFPVGPATLNVGSGHGSSLIEAIDAIAAVVGYAPEIEWSAARALDVGEIVLDTTLLNSLIDVSITPLDEGIARTHAAIADTGTLSVAG